MKGRRGQHEPQGRSQAGRGLEPWGAHVSWGTAVGSLQELIPPMGGHGPQPPCPGGRTRPLAIVQAGTPQGEFPVRTGCSHPLTGRAGARLAPCNLMLMARPPPQGSQ